MKKLALLLMVLGAVVTSSKAQEVKKEIKKEVKEEKKESKGEAKEEKKEKKNDIKENDVPAVIVAKLKSLYPVTDNLEWEKGENNYQAEFEINNLETTVTFSPAGAVMKTKSEILVTQLPQTAQTYLKDHTGDKIKKVFKMSDENGKVTYKAKGEDKFVMFDASGNYISQKKD